VVRGRIYSKREGGSKWLHKEVPLKGGGQADEKKDTVTHLLVGISVKKIT